MDWTVYSSHDARTLRTPLGESGASDQGASDMRAPDNYVDRLVKYIPPDVIGAYAALHGFISSPQVGGDPNVSWGIFGIMLFATPLYLLRVRKVRKPAQLLISTLAFAVWAFAYPGVPFSTLHTNPIWAPIALTLFTFLIPILEV